MADAIRIDMQGALAQARTNARAADKNSMGFQQVLNRSLLGQATRAQPRAPAPQPAPRPPSAANETPAARATRPRTTQQESSAALSQAMTLEGVPASWRAGLEFIMDKESRGQIDARNPVHSARGLFQLTRAQYRMNPNGEASFGNGVEEAQGGIRYVKQRYGSADAAVKHWEKHRWY